MASRASSCSKVLLGLFVSRKMAVRASCKRERAVSRFWLIDFLRFMFYYFFKEHQCGDIVSVLPCFLVKKPQLFDKSFPVHFALAPKNPRCFLVNFLPRTEPSRSIFLALARVSLAIIIFLAYIQPSQEESAGAHK